MTDECCEDGTVDNGKTLVETALRLHLDVIITDVSISNGIVLCRHFERGVGVDHLNRPAVHYLKISEVGQIFQDLEFRVCSTRNFS